MKRYLKEIYSEEEHDGFEFTLDDNDELDVAPFTYKKKEKPIETHELGLKYHVITYNEMSDGSISKLEMFEAIIGNPWHYIGGLIECGFFGMICKKTKNSYKIVNDMFEDLLEHVDIDDDFNEATE